MRKNLVYLSLALAACAVSLPAMAATGSITKTVVPSSIRLYSAGTAPVTSTLFTFQVADFQKGSANPTKTLTLIRFDSAAYPAAYTHTTELCIYQPYQSGPTRCIPVSSGSSSSTTALNDVRFDAGSRISLRHTVTGAPSETLQPSRNESVTVEFSY
ncbi:hypothetical protein SMB77_001409 [Cronobacter sakazakii]|uniref:hypothetical protein n=1 Tax=Cronobacter sakazakii TaxID=28141 RepID=UPI0011AFFFD1|nr:hypothetical protein [Cronobacter sakazakii]ELY2616713.1 hypothetical protein [Cronobacter sakazakii]ELY2632554.1 hypothetical protein [Cronobacter sakazakii]ELY2662585.1 hypothetical protein [Cronobacter sakazakii]ELY4116148.1 hypothetical protein [Cronobacter sakazakii]ELY4499780.1 hypothetical protein [Cronobacter sakazakii]